MCGILDGPRYSEACEIFQRTGVGGSLHYFPRFEVLGSVRDFSWLEVLGSVRGFPKDRGTLKHA